MDQGLTWLKEKRKRKGNAEKEDNHLIVVPTEIFIESGISRYS